MRFEVTHCVPLEFISNKLFFSVKETVTKCNIVGMNGKLFLKQDKRFLYNIRKKGRVTLGCDTSYGKISDLHIQFMHCNGKKKIVKYRAVIFDTLEPCDFLELFLPFFSHAFI
ncbi:unnamed protein product [Rhizopus stolonifer]